MTKTWNIGHNSIKLTKYLAYLATLVYYPGNVNSVLWGGGVQNWWRIFSTVGVFSTFGGYHRYCGGNIHSANVIPTRYSTPSTELMVTKKVLQILHRTDGIPLNLTTSNGLMVSLHRTKYPPQYCRVLIYNMQCIVIMKINGVAFFETPGTSNK